MKAIVQRVNTSNVSINGDLIAEIGKGLNVLLGVCEGDKQKDAEILADKIVHLRCFDDEDGKMNLSLMDKGAEILSIPQFTLCADCSSGRRPGFDKAADPGLARDLYEYFNSQLEQQVGEIETGRFGTYMGVEIENDGPVTFILDSKQL